MAFPTTAFSLCAARTAVLCLLLGAIAAVASNDETSPSARLSVVSHAGGHIRSKHAPRFRQVVAYGRGAQHHRGLNIPGGQDSGKHGGLNMEFDDDGVSRGDAVRDSMELSNSEFSSGDDVADSNSSSGSSGGPVIGENGAPAKGGLATTEEDDLEKNWQKMQGLAGLVVDADQDSAMAIDASKIWRQQSVAALKQFPSIAESTDEMRKRMLAGNEAIKKDVAGENPTLRSFLTTAANRDQATRNVSDTGSVSNDDSQNEFESNGESTSSGEVAGDSTSGE